MYMYMYVFMYVCKSQFSMSAELNSPNAFAKVVPCFRRCSGGATAGGFGTNAGFVFGLASKSLKLDELTAGCATAGCAAFRSPPPYFANNSCTAFSVDLSSFCSSSSSLACLLREGLHFDLRVAPVLLDELKGTSLDCTCHLSIG